MTLLEDVLEMASDRFVMLLRLTSINCIFAVFKNFFLQQISVEAEIYVLLRLLLVAAMCAAKHLGFFLRTNIYIMECGGKMWKESECEPKIQIMPLKRIKC